MVQPRPHRGVGNAQHRRGLGRGAVLDIAQHEHQPLLQRQIVQRPRQCAGKVAPFAGLVRGHRRRRLRQLPGQLGQGASAARRRPQVVASVVDGDADQKGAQGRLLVEPANRRRQRQEHILDQILGRLVIAHQPAGEGPHRPVVKVVGQAHRGRIARAQTHDQPRLGVCRVPLDQRGRAEGSQGA